jgi:hypothetical protein
VEVVVDPPCLDIAMAEKDWLAYLTAEAMRKEAEAAAAAAAEAAAKEAEAAAAAAIAQAEETAARQEQLQRVSVFAT